jgi:hypothetical protein
MTKSACDKNLGSEKFKMEKLCSTEFLTCRRISMRHAIHSSQASAITQKAAPDVQSGVELPALAAIIGPRNDFLVLEFNH